jgi:hypothetical protein
MQTEQDIRKLQDKILRLLYHTNQAVLDEKITSDEMTKFHEHIGDYAVCLAWVLGSGNEKTNWYTPIEEHMYEVEGELNEILER